MPTLLDRSWYVRMRWAFAAAQAVLAAGVALGAWSGSIRELVVAGLVGLASNAWLAWRTREGERAVLVALLTDAVLLTATLDALGGASSPFVSLYLVPPVLAATQASRSVAWGVVAVTAALYLGLAWLGPPLSHEHGPAAMRWHEAGMFVAWALAGPIAVEAIGRARDALALAERKAAEAREASARAERLASLASLAAGAAHELSTPLAAILVAAREVERATTDERVRADALAIQEEVGRCGEVLDDLCADAGAGRAEQACWIAVRDLLEEALDPPLGREITLQEGSDDERLVHVPVRAVSRAVRRLLGNAADATPAEGAVRLSGSLRGGALSLVVADTGVGMSAEQAGRATEAFFTTKATGRGLGLFYVATVARELGGELSLVSRPGEGTTATLRLDGLAVRDAERA